jgi:intracellular sulfur oxidation DsrE/DsrF family protein
MKDPFAPSSSRRGWLGRLLALGAGAAAAQPVARAAAPATGSAPIGQGDAPHKIVYQLNQADEAYQEAIFNSISALLKKYTDDVSIAVVVWGPGIHLLAKNPRRPVSELHKQRVRSMAESYGIEFIACGNTMHTVGWTEADMLPFAKIEEVGAAAVMELQEKGYKYLAW